MSSDRLRAAADRLDANAVIPAATGRQINTDTATAALLRAVADDIEDWRTRLEGPGPDPAPYGIPTRGWDAALALADVILGGDS